MGEYDDVCVVVPTYDEAETIGQVVEGFRGAGLESVLVVDGGSTDGTRRLARESGARVVRQSGTGKGQAVREAIGLVEAPYILMADGDATYRPEDADRMLQPLLDGEADHVIGDRFADMRPGAMSRLNRVGNRLINRAFRTIHGRDLGDILSGYRAFTRESAERFLLTADGFGIETEMAVECVKQGVETAVVPITYESRPDASETNLHPFRDGAIIMLTLYQMAKTNNPMFYFGSIGLLSALTGVGLAAWVAVEWVTRGISHEVIAVVAGVAVLFGIQLIMFGVLSDLIVSLNREQTRRFERLAKRHTGSDGVSGSEGAVEDDETTLGEQ
ncbi:MAG: S-layer glycoprotein N-glycosyltransferase AglJ [Salinirussus sp.]